MTLRDDVGSLRGLRPPTKREAEAIAAFVDAYYTSKIRVSKRWSSIFSVVGVAFLVAYAQSPWLAVIMSALAFLLTFVLLHDKSVLRCRNEAFAEQRYLVVEGTVNKIQGNPELIEVSNVWVTSRSGQSPKRGFRVLSRDVEAGSPILIAYAQGETPRKDNVWAFTPYMLTEQGAQEHW